MQPTRKTRRAIRRQPLLNAIAKRNARVRELSAAMQLPCAACGASLAAHVGPGNRWKGCR